MQILQVIDGLTVGGAEKMVLIFSRLLVERNIPVSVVSFDSDWDAPYAVELRRLGVPVHHLTGKLLNICRIERLVRLIKECQAGIVHTYLSYANIAGTVAAKIAGVPVITSLRSISLEPYHPIRARLETWLMRYASDRVMANGYSVAHAHQARLKNQKIHVIQNAVGTPSSLSEPERCSLRKELVGDPGKTIFISVGRLSPPKGYDTLLEAFSKVNAVYPRTSLVIVGDGELRSDLEKQIDQLGLHGVVFLTGERSDIDRLLTAGDIYISSSHWEGMSVAILEAMAAGLPVIATQVGDAPFVLTNETGILIPPKDAGALSQAAMRLLSDPELPIYFGRMAKSRAEEEYGLNPWCNRMLELYVDVNPELRTVIYGQ